VPETKAALDLRPILISAHQPIGDYVTSISFAIEQQRDNAISTALTTSPAFVLELVEGQTEVILHRGAVQR
jgi:hypothetical protein